MGAAKFHSLPLANPWTIIEYRFRYITSLPRESMCKIWLELIQPLWICACWTKTRFSVDIFVNICTFGLKPRPEGRMSV